MKTLKGHVSSVHEDLCYYEIKTEDNEIYRVFLYLQDPEVPLMPAHLCNVTLSHPRALNQCNSVIALGPDTEVLLEDHFRQMDETFKIATRIKSRTGIGLWSITSRRKSSLSVEDAFFFNKIITELQENLELDSDALMGLVLLTLLTTDEERELNRDINVVTCTNQKFLPNNVVDVYRKINPKENIYDSTCATGCYPNLENQFLVGVLRINVKYNSFVLEDSYCEMPVIFVNNKLPQYTEGLVIIDTWTVFTEVNFHVGSEKKEFILVDLSNVRLVRKSYESSPAIKPETELSFHKSLKTTIYIRRKSVPIFGMEKKPEIWLDAVILNEKTFKSETPAIYVLNEELFPTAIYLQEEKIYVLHYDNQFPISNSFDYPELQKLKFRRTVYSITKETIFQKLDSAKSNQLPTKIRTLNELKEYLNSPSHNNEIISFTGKIYVKAIPKNNFRSYILPRHKLPNYGIPGEGDTQIRLTFEIDKANCLFMDLYLVEENNFQSLEILENMVLKLNHVMISNKSLKSTVFTNFEIVGFDNDINYRSIVPKNLLPCTWLDDKQCFTALRSTQNVTQFTIVQGIVHIHSVLYMKWVTQCPQCSTKKCFNQACTKCKTKSSDLGVEARLLVSGEQPGSEQFQMSCLDKSLLDVLFDLQYENPGKNRYAPFLEWGELIYEKDGIERNQYRSDFLGHTYRYLARLGGPKITYVSAKAVCIKTPYHDMARTASRNPVTWRALYMTKLIKPWPDLDKIDIQDLDEEKLKQQKLQQEKLQQEKLQAQKKQVTNPKIDHETMNSIEIG